MCYFLKIFIWINDTLTIYILVATELFNISTLFSILSISLLKNFFGFGITHILGEKALDDVGYSPTLQDVPRYPDLGHVTDVATKKMSLDIAKCPLGGKIGRG